MMAVKSPPSDKRVKSTKESNQNFQVGNAIDSIDRCSSFSKISGSSCRCHFHLGVQAQGLYRSIGACGAVQAWKSQPCGVFINFV
jgi:hypothetical protein